MRTSTKILWAAALLGSMAILRQLPMRVGPDWVSELPPQFEINKRLAYGSTQLPNGTGVCGATIYQLSKSQSQEIGRSGVATLSGNTRGPDGLKYGDWESTPIPKEVYERYVLHTNDQPVGLSCSHGTWQKEWRIIAQTSNNFYSTNGKSLILLDISENKDNPHRFVQVGYFYNP